MTIAITITNDGEPDQPSIEIDHLFPTGMGSARIINTDYVRPGESIKLNAHQHLQFHIKETPTYTSEQVEHFAKQYAPPAGAPPVEKLTTAEMNDIGVQY